VFGLLTKARRNAGFWLSAQLLFVLPNGVLSLCDAMVEGPLLAETCRFAHVFSGSFRHGGS
jgi:hypothetical protein